MVSVGGSFHGAHCLMCRSGITHEEMVQESKRHWQRLEQNAQKHQKVSRDQQVARPSACCLRVRLFDSVVHLAPPCK